MALGLLKLDYTSRVLPYDDEATPIKLTGKKMLPILEHDGRVMNESLDIIAFLDQNNILRTKETIKTEDFKKFEDLLNSLGNQVHSLAMPYWIWTPEFNEQSRMYFQKKKEEKRGPFKELVKNKSVFIKELEKFWPDLEANFKPFYQSSELSLYDILLASHLWGLYVVPEFQFPVSVHQYLQRVKNACGFDYHKDFWR